MRRQSEIQKDSPLTIIAFLLTMKLSDQGCPCSSGGHVAEDSWEEMQFRLWHLKRRVLISESKAWLLDQVESLPWKTMLLVHRWPNYSCSSVTITLLRSPEA